MSLSADYVIVGGGTAGSLLAERLSKNSQTTVIVVEAGPADSHPLITIPKGMAKLLSNPRYTYYYPTSPDREDIKPEVMMRGRMLGGSSGINGMVYHRGQPEDYDRWEELGLKGWGWSDMQRCFTAFEDHTLPETPWRGRHGELPIRVARSLPPLEQAMLEAARSAGLPIKEEPNLLDQRGVSPVAETIDSRGRRVSAARAFLTHAVRKRPNLQVLTETRVERILFDEDRRAVAARARRGNQTFDITANAEIVLCTGTIESPRLLQVSGVGPADVLQKIGVPVVQASDGVGANYRDHYCILQQWRLRHHRDSDNRQLGGWRLGASALRYMLLRTGPLAYGSNTIAMFSDVLANDGRPDAETLFAPYSVDQKPGVDKIRMENEPGAHTITFPLRGTSEGSVEAASSDFDVPPIVRPRYLDTEYDRQVTAAAVRRVRAVMAQAELRPFVVGETGPFAEAHSDDEIIEGVLKYGNSGYHSIGTCRMGPEGVGAVLDERLRVRGVRGLRVVDCSVMPEQVSANTMGPVLAIAQRASEIIAEERLP